MKTKIYEELAPLYKLWRDTCLGEQNSEKHEADFIQDILRNHIHIRSIIDLGGGIGLHAKHLMENGFDVTLLDQSEKALTIAKDLTPELKIVKSSFEDLNLDQTFDASICMWSTLSYISKENQKHFYSWIGNHTKSIIILDEPNFALYPVTFHKIYEGQDSENKLRITRDWIMNEHLKSTNFIYQIKNKISNRTETIIDSELQQYVTTEELKNLLGDKWQLERIYGDYFLDSEYDPQTSPRMIFIFVPA